MIDHGMIAVENDKLTVVKHFISTGTDVSSSLLRKNHHQHIDLGSRSLDEDDILDRDITGVTVNFDKSKMEEAKEVIRDFRRSMALLLKGDNCTEVYRLQVMLFPLTKDIKE